MEMKKTLYIQSFNASMEKTLLPPILIIVSLLLGYNK